MTKLHRKWNDVFISFTITWRVSDVLALFGSVFTLLIFREFKKLKKNSKFSMKVNFKYTIKLNYYLNNQYWMQILVSELTKYFAKLKESKYSQISFCTGVLSIILEILEFCLSIAFWILLDKTWIFLYKIEIFKKFLNI